MSSHTEYLQQAITLAMKGRGSTEPNPSVGCIVVKDGRIIGQGHTQPFGGAHAEPTALASCVESPKGATAYVTLEPCCHTNKKTPPCVPTLIAAGISHVVLGCLDPNPDVNGKGIALLRAANIQVTMGILEKECQQLIAPFIASTLYNRPYITLKWAQSSDGKIACPNGARVQISNPTSMQAVHFLRSRSNAILIGSGTLLNDNPLLTSRHPHSTKQPLRVVLDTHLQTPPDSQLAMTASSYPTLIYCSESALARSSPLTTQGIEIQTLPTDATGLSLPALLADLHRRQIAHLLIEPGPRLLQSILDLNLWDRLWRFQSPNPLPGGLSLPTFSTPPPFTLGLAGDTLAETLNPASPLLFSTVPSADFLHLALSVGKAG